MTAMKDNLTGNEGGGTAIAHVPSLDGVRGIAILLVLAHHFGVPADLPHRSASVFTQWIERLLYVGWAGVDLFFVLSGFLITSILLVSKNAPEYFRRFYSRRILRIFPLYYFTLILGLVVLPRLLTYQNVGLLRDVTSGQAWLWTYTLNIGLALGWVTGPAIFGHYWTLAVEEQYYLIWPWVVKVASSRTILILSGLMLFAALVLRIIWFDSEFGWAGAYRFTLTRADSLALGGAIAVLTLNTTFRSRLLTWLLLD
jgi:peptidoglycan/LPS O-acetylase OafA/YrhL